MVNPAAKTTPGAPIYGMPILDVDQARQVVFLKRSMRPGFAGIDNELLFDPKTTLLFGDAKDSLTKVRQRRQGPVTVSGRSTRWQSMSDEDDPMLKPDGHRYGPAEPRRDQRSAGAVVVRRRWGRWW